MRLQPLIILLTVGIGLLSCREHQPDKPLTVVRKMDPDSIRIFNSLDTVEVFRRLFDNPRMKGDTAIWSPNFYERQSIGPSYDDSCHTTIDTILPFKDHGSRNCAVYIFGTRRFYRDNLDSNKIKFGGCHSCGASLSIALFSQDTTGRWQLYRFEKFFTRSGIFGGSGSEGIGKLSVIALGDNWNALLLKRPMFANMGEEEASTDVYSIEEFQMDGFPEQTLSTMLSFSHHLEIDDPVTDVPKKVEDVTLSIIKKKDDYYTIKLETITNGKRSYSYYRYSESDNSCVHVAGPGRFRKK